MDHLCLVLDRLNFCSYEIYVKIYYYLFSLVFYINFSIKYLYKTILVLNMNNIIIINSNITIINSNINNTSKIIFRFNITIMHIATFSGKKTISTHLN
jgi:hypothetical protein